MRFSSWSPLGERGAGPAAPPGPGLFQLRRAAGLSRFPRGRSAMVAYGGGEDLPAALSAHLRSEAHLRAVAELGPLLVRFAAPGLGRSAEEALSTLRRRFMDQFGAAPEEGRAEAP